MLRQVAEGLDKVKVPRKTPQPTEARQGLGTEELEALTKQVDASISSFKKSVGGSTSNKFLVFDGISQQVQAQKYQSHECKKTWLLANFENIDPKFYNKWKEAE